MPLFGSKKNADDDDDKGTDLFLCAATGNAKVMATKLKKKKYLHEVNAKNPEGKTKLMLASMNGHADCVTALLNASAIVDESDDEGCTALFSACAFGHEPTAAILLGRGAKVNHQSKKGDTPLMQAAVNGHIECVYLLLNAHADVNLCTQDRCTALVLGCHSREWKVAGLLVAKGCDLNVRTRKGWTPLGLAAKAKNVEMVKYLLENKAEPNVGDGTALRAASRAGCMASCELLLEYGADLFAIDKEGKDAVEVALLSKKKECARFLQQRIAALAARNAYPQGPMMMASPAGRGPNGAGAAAGPFAGFSSPQEAAEAYLQQSQQGGGAAGGGGLRSFKSPMAAKGLGDIGSAIKSQLPPAAPAYESSGGPAGGAPAVARNAKLNPSLPDAPAAAAASTMDQGQLDALKRRLAMIEDTRKKLEKELEHSFSADNGPKSTTIDDDDDSDDDGWDATKNMSQEERQRWFLSKIRQLEKDKKDLVRQVELLGFSETEEMRECRKANEKLQSFLMVYFDRTWRQVANDVKPAIKDRIKELLKERTPVDRRSAIFNFQDQADFAPVMQYLELYEGEREFDSELTEHLRGALPWYVNTIVEIQENQSGGEADETEGPQKDAFSYWEDEFARLNQLAYYNMCHFKAACERTDNTITREKREWFMKRLERYDIVRCIFASEEDFHLEGALRQWGNWVTSTLLPSECRALYWNLFQKPEKDGRIRAQDIAPMGRKAGTQIHAQTKQMLRERMLGNIADWFHDGTTTPMWDPKTMPKRPEWDKQFQSKLQEVEMNKEKEKESKRMEKEMKKVELLTFMQKVPELAKNTRDWPTIQLLIKRSKVWIVEMQSRPAEAPKPPPAVRRQTIAGDGGEGGLPAAPKLPSLQKLNLAIQFASLGRTTIPDSILQKMQQQASLLTQAAAEDTAPGDKERLQSQVLDLESQIAEEKKANKAAPPAKAAPARRATMPAMPSGPLPALPPKK